jgi:DNA-directed RNA polymerase subunit beta'
MTEREYRELKREYGASFKAGMGAEAIKDLLASVDLAAEADQLKRELQEATGSKARTCGTTSWIFIEAFFQSEKGNA